MRKQLFPLFLFLGLVGAGIALQHEAGIRRKALEDSLGGARVGVSLETAAAFARQLGTIEPGAPQDLIRQPIPELEQPAIARSESNRESGIGENGIGENGVPTPEVEAQGEAQGEALDGTGSASPSDE